MQFRTQVSYVNINNLKPVFGGNVYESWCSHLTDESKEAYDLLNHIKVSTKKKKVKHSGNIETFHGRFNVLSALRSPFKLKIFNCSHHNSSESTVYQGSAIEVIIPDNYFIMFHCGLVHCGTPSWFICNGEYFSNTMLFFTIVEKKFNLGVQRKLMMFVKRTNITVKKKIVLC